MKLANVVWQMTEDGYIEIAREELDYSGPVALCDRGQSKAVANQGMQQSAQDQANAQTALTNTNTAVGDFNKRLGFMGRFVNRTYGAGGDFQRTQNAINTSAATAGARSAEGDMALRAGRTGENTAGFATAAGETRRAASRDLADKMAQSEQSRLQQLTQANGMLLDESKYPASVYGQLYGTGTSGASGNLEPAASAAATPSGWDIFGGAFAKGLGQGLGGAAAGG